MDLRLAAGHGVLHLPRPNLVAVNRSMCSIIFLTSWVSGLEASWVDHSLQEVWIVSDQLAGEHGQQVFFPSKRALATLVTEMV